MRDDPDGRRAAPAARHPRDRPARVGARTLGRRRHQRREHHGERGEAPRGGRSTGTVAFSRCARSRSSRPLQEGAWRLAEHGGGSGDPEQDRAPLHRADDRGLAQSRRARRDRRLRARSPRRQGLEPLLPGADGARAVRVGHHPRAVRRGARLALPDPEEVRPPDAREREVRSALHQDRSGECRRRSPVRARRIRTRGSTRLRTSPGPACPRLRLARRGKPRRRRVCRRSGPTPEGPAGARRGRTTWGYGRTGMSPLAPTSRSSRGLFAARVSRTSGRPRSCSPAFAAAPRSAGDAGSAR